MRWLLVPLAFGIVFTGVYALLTGPVRLDPGAAMAGLERVSERVSEKVSNGAGPHGEIREKSREQLRELLRRADAEDRR